MAASKTDTPAVAPAAATPAPAAATPTPAKAAPVAAVVGDVSMSVMLPATASKRQSASIYPFDKLVAPQRDAAGNVTAYASFAVKNKAAKDLSTVVGNANRKAKEPKKDAAGNILYKRNEIKGPDGAVTGYVPTTEPMEYVVTKHFRAVDVDPKTDPDGATARVFRDL